MKTNLSVLKPNPINNEIYSQTDLTDLILSLETNGQLEAIVLNKDNVILSGHRRYYSMLQLNWTDCDVRHLNVESDVVALIEFNRSRIKSVNDILNESRYLEKELKKEIGRGRTATKERSGKKMKTIIEVSKKLGLSTTQLKKIKSISNYEPTLINEIDNGELSVNKAYQIVREKYINKSTTEDKEVFVRKLTKLLKDFQPTKDEIRQILSKIYPYSVSNLPSGELKRDELIYHLNQLKKLDEREIVQYRKYREIEKLNPDMGLVNKLEKQIWTPTDIHNKELTIKEIESIEPVIEIPNNKEFDILRTKLSSHEWVRNPGRLIPIVVKNKSDSKYLGLITIASDMLMVENRDNYIGWTERERLRGLKHLTVVSTCVGTQPLGFNFLGGKLISMVATSKQVRELWKEKYDDTLVGMTTTSLFGQFSMYNSVPRWKPLGETKGSVLLKPDDNHYKFWVEWIKQTYPEEYERAISKSSPKQNVLNLIFKYLDIAKKQYQSEHRKGLYFSNFYENGREFLCDEISEGDLVLNDKFNESEMDWWKPRAVRRYTKLYDEGRLNENTLWYKGLETNTFKSWLSSRGIQDLI